jgi:gliding motility-associated lipoprotein GldD
MRPRTKLLMLISAVCIILSACRDVQAPKPRGYFRIDLPEKEYSVIDLNDNVTGNPIPVSFEYPQYGNISLKPDGFSGPGWFNIDFPGFRAKIYLTYRIIENNLPSLIDEAYKMSVTNHITKADAINEEVILFPDRKVYGILYDLKGSTATAVQFFVTDSTKNFFRGSLYFEAEPNPDSLAPVIDYFRADIRHIIETLNWTKN